MLLSVLTFQGALVIIDTFSSKAFYFAWCCGWAARLRNIPYVPIMRGGNLMMRFDRNPVLCRQLFKNSKAIISVSKFLQSGLKAAGYESIYLPNMIDLKNYPFTNRVEFFPRLLWVRSFHKTYNPLLAVRILKELMDYHPLANLAMVGPDKDDTKTRVMELAKQLGVSSGIQITGKQSKEEWIRLSSGYDLFVNTTNYDNMPVSVIEAMALGLPVISTNVGGMPYLIQDGVDGYLVEPGDVTGFVKRIIELIQHPEKAREMAANARKKAEGFDSAVVMAKWKSLIEGIIYGV
ncbi:MAG: glycosyltransferase family 4 protein [Cyclobacteriaceae bacterium]|nr:glycosyltransferase family 4 protein [Cyclobacteriaceae bacterium]